jgi:hypothetical protein
VKQAALIIGKSLTSGEKEIVLTWDEEVIFIVFSKESKKRIISFDKLCE